MALIKLGPIVAGIRGALGGVVFARNRGGSFARNNTFPIDPATAKQVTARARLASLQVQWADVLTTPQREAWNALANATTFINALGEEYKPTGLNLYIRTNVQRLIANQGLIVAAPISATASLPALTIEHTTLTGIELTALSGGDISSGDYNIYLSTVKNFTINFFKGPFSHYSAGDVTGLPSPPVLLVPNADLTEDSRVFLRVVVVTDDGRVSQSSIYPVDVGTFT